MHNVWCIACGHGMGARPEEGPMRLYSCSACRASAGVSLECRRCRLRWNARRETDVCPRCLENILAEDHGLYPGKGWKGPI